MIRNAIADQGPRTKRSHIVIAVIVVVPLLLVASRSFAAPITNPGLAAGARYRLAFVTSGTTTVTSSDITTYDAFVQGAADAIPELNSLSATWKVIGTTPTVDAIDNTDTCITCGPGSTVPIYLLDASLLATNGADLWDGTILAALGIDEGGNPLGTSLVWTGTFSSGTGDLIREIGGVSSYTLAGLTTSTDGGWVAWELRNDETDSWPLYAISSVLTVPESRPAVLLTLVFVAVLLVRRVRST